MDDDDRRLQLMGNMADDIVRQSNEIARLRAENERLRERNLELSRRYQEAEKGVREKLEAAAPERRTIGRALANAGYFLERDGRLAAVAEVERLRRKLAETRAMLSQWRYSRDAAAMVESIDAALAPIAPGSEGTAGKVKATADD